MNRNIVEIEYRISGFDMPLYNSKPNWDFCEFEQHGKCFDVSMHLWEPEVCSQQDTNLAIERLNCRAHQLVLAWELSLGRRLNWSWEITQLPELLSKSDHTAISSKLAISDFCDGDVNPPLPPAYMPQVPLEAYRWVRILAEVNDFNDYVEEQLKHQYLIIEELFEEFESRLSQDEKELKIRI